MLGRHKLICGDASSFPFLRLWDGGDEFCAAAALNDLLRGLARFIKLPMSQRALIR
jgi:hypothetical protein